MIQAVFKLFNIYTSTNTTYIMTNKLISPELLVQISHDVANTTVGMMDAGLPPPDVCPLTPRPSLDLKI